MVPSMNEMSKPAVITEWRNFLQSISTGSQIEFESAVADPHAAWHRSRTFKGMPIGFFCFHHDYMAAHDAVIETNGGTAPPAWVGKNDPPGAPDIVPYPDTPPYPDTIIQNTDPVQFSTGLEEWHDRVHMNPKYPPDFMDPRMNVYMPLFYCWHRLIDDYFMSWCAKNISYDEILAKYADVV
jgi:hypothetical protein